MTNIPAGAPRSEDGQSWWDGERWLSNDGQSWFDGAQWQTVAAAAAKATAAAATPAASASPPNNRQALVDGAVDEARGRLVMLRQDISDTVADFYGMAKDAVAELHGKPESDLGWGLFKTLIEVVTV